MHNLSYFLVEHGFNNQGRKLVFVTNPGVFSMYIFATQCRSSLLFQTMNFVKSNVKGLQK